MLCTDEECCTDEGVLCTDEGVLCIQTRGCCTDEGVLYRRGGAVPMRGFCTEKGAVQTRVCVYNYIRRCASTDKGVQCTDE